jgi:FkbM family methyltransferase
LIQNLKETYWKLREAVPHFLNEIRSDPPLRRISRFAMTHARRVVRIGGIAIRLNPGMGAAAVTYMLDGRYEKPERRILEHALTADDRVLELGTGVGYLSALCARKIGNDRVVTFEANPLLRPLIEETYSINNVSPRVEFYMLGERAGETDFYVNDEFWSSSTISRRKKRERCIKIPVRALNEALASYKPNFLVIDIEGGEKDLIRYMNVDGVNKICIELHPWAIGKESESEVRNFFKAHGFREDPAVSDDEHVLFLRS